MRYLRFAMLMVLAMALFSCFYWFLCPLTAVCYGGWTSVRPDPVTVQLDFRGRVLPSYSLHPGTFSVSVPWEDTKNWGDDSVMSFEVTDSGKVLLTAWRPDPRTSGIFERAITVLERPWPDTPIRSDHLSWSVASAEQISNNQLRLTPSFPTGELSVDSFAMVLFWLFALVGCWSWSRALIKSLRNLRRADSVPV